MQLFGIELAPLNVPLKRRLQTFSIASLVFLLSMGFFASPPLTVYLLFSTKYCWLVAIYLIWVAYDSRICDEGGRRSEIIRNLFMWKWLHEYFPIKLIRESKKALDPKKNYFFICHPHGIWCTGVMANMAVSSKKWNQLFPEIKPYVLTLRVFFLIPFLRDFIMALGLLCASEKSINYMFRQNAKGNAIALMAGGVAEFLNSHPNNYRIVLKDRQGFVRLALKNGVSLVPVISFGEVDLYSQVPNPQGSLLRRLQDFMRKEFGIVPVLFNGRGIFQYNVGLLPRRRAITTVVGEPIGVEKVSEPTQEQIKSLHLEFMQSIYNLFEKYKYKCLKNAEDVQLIID